MTENFALHRILFDPAMPAGQTHYADAAELETKSPKAIPWPAGLEPTPLPYTGFTAASELPNADVLVVTYTTAEGYALADILTPGRHCTDWMAYKNNWSAIEAQIDSPEAPSRRAGCSGYWAKIQIGELTAVLIKSEMHPSTDGPNLPMVMCWQQWISQVQPKLVITTGTAGAVTKDVSLGDVIVTGRVSWDCTAKFKNKPFAGAHYVSPIELPSKQELTTTKVLSLIDENALGMLPTGTPAPVIWLDDAAKTPVTTITTDFFAFDDVENSYGLRTYDPHARAVEMDDAALPLALGNSNLPWISVRNASDPQMPQQSSVEDEAKAASAIYEKYGQVTSWGSAITCWALIVALVT